MTMLSCVASLFILSSAVHFFTLFRYGKSPTSTAVFIFGSLYLTLGILILNLVTWAIESALVITIIGLIGATATLKKVPEQRTMTLCMNAIDIIVIALIGYSLFA